MKHTISVAYFLGTCTVCKCPTMGKYEENKGRFVVMKCVSCERANRYRLPPFVEMKSMGDEA